MKNLNVDYYFVKNGLFNGEEGTFAVPCGGTKPQADGWYFMFEDMDDGIGPYPSREVAMLEAFAYNPEE